MNKIDILIIEDNKEEAEILEEVLTMNGFNVVDKIHNLKDSVEYINSKPFDFVIIDIYLGSEPSGIEVAKAVNNKFGSQKPFLFLTGISDRATFEEAKNLGPHSYLLKPFNELELIYAIEISIEKQKNAQNQSTEPGPKSCFPMLIKKQSTFYKLEQEDILYIEVDGRYCSIVTKETNFLVQSTLGNFQKQLPGNDFIRTHRNYILNRDTIEKIHLNENHIVLKGGKSISIGRAYKNDFLNHYNIVK